MFWVCQSNLYTEYGYTALMEAITRREIPHVVVKPVPIINTLVSGDFDSHEYKGNIEDKFKVVKVETVGNGTIFKEYERK